MRSAEEIEISTELHFRVTPVGNRKIEFLDITNEGGTIKLQPRNTRPASVQEQALWDLAVNLRQILTSMGWTSENGVPGKQHLPGGGGIDAGKTRNSLGHPLPEPKESIRTDRPEGS